MTMHPLLTDVIRTEHERRVRDREAAQRLGTRQAHRTRRRRP